MIVLGKNYELYASSFTTLAGALPRSDARQAYERLMRARPTRIEMLRELLKANRVELGSSDAAIQAVNDWFYAAVEPDTKNAGQLLQGWYSIVSDIALFLGDVMIERHPNLHWEFFIWGKKNVSYQRPVIMGFSTENRSITPTLMAIVA